MSERVHRLDAGIEVVPDRGVGALTRDAVPGVSDLVGALGWSAP